MSFPEEKDGTAPGFVRRLMTLNRGELRLLLLLGFAAFFNRYDGSLMSLMLVQIQEGLGIPEHLLGYVGSAAHAGSLLAFVGLWLADRIGRRRVLLITITGYAFFTLLTALAPDARTYVLAQMAARLFLSAEFMLSLVVIAEELRAENRGLGIGLISTLALCGQGFAMLLFGLVDSIPFGWRGLYGLGVVPLLVLAFLRRSLKETRHFAQLRGQPGFALRGWAAPLINLLRCYPRRFVAVVVVVFFWHLSNAPVDFFLATYLQRVNGWTPAQFSALALTAIGLGVVIQPLVGRLSDRWGRRRVGIPSLLAEPTMAIVFYSLAGGPVIAAFLLWAFSSVSNDTVLRTYQSELFPTSSRSTASGTLGMIGTFGAVLSLTLEGWLFGIFGSHWTAVRILAGCGLLIPFLVLWRFPETGSRELDAIAPDRAPGGQPETDGRL